MRPFAHEVIIHWSQNRAEAVGVGHRPFGVVAQCAITDGLAFRKRDGAFEETVGISADKRARNGAVQCHHGDFFCAGDETACHKAVRCLVDTQDGKGVGMQTALDCLDLSLSDSASLFLFGSIERFFHQALQISDAYWRIVLSDENQPIRAVLCTVFSYQLLGSLQIVSTSRCAWA